MNLYEALCAAAGKYPDKAALTIQGRLVNKSINFASFLEKVDDFAGVMAAKGIRPRDLVAIDIKQDINSYAAIFALFKIGAAAYIFDPSTKPLVEPVAIISSVFNLKLRQTFKNLYRKFSAGKVTLGFINLNDSKLEKHNTKHNNPIAIVYNYKNKNGLVFTVEKKHESLYECSKSLCSVKKCDESSLMYNMKYSDVITNIANGRSTLLLGLKHPTIAKALTKIDVTGIGMDANNMRGIMKYIKNPLNKIQNIFLYDNSVKSALLVDINRYMPESSTYMFYCIFDIIVTELDISEISDAEYARTYQGKGVLVGYDVRKASIKINNSRSDFTVGEILLNLPDTSVKSQLHNNLIEVDGKTWIKTGKAGYIDNLGRLWYTGDYANTVKVDEKEIFIFAVEESVNANPYVAKAAFVVNNNTRVLYVELTNPRHVSHTEEIKLEANNNFGCNIVQQIKVGKIPMSKHNPMHIDYQKIIKG